MSERIKLRGLGMMAVVLIFLLLVSCSPATSPAKSLTPSATALPMTETSLVPSGTATPVKLLLTSQPPYPPVTVKSTSFPTSTSVNTPTREVQPTNIPTLTATKEVTPAASPTYAILRGTVLEQANCRYGPGAAYLYKYGLYAGNNLEIIGRNETGTWIVVRAIGGTNPCWLKASLMDLDGEVMSLAPAELPLPQSPYYGPLTGVWADRQGDNVIISWDTLQLRAGDDSLQYPYLVEAWLCQDGQLSFSAIGSWETMVTVRDEAGCTDPSHARVYGVEKHGYTNWVTVPWPVP